LRIGKENPSSEYQILIIADDLFFSVKIAALLKQLGSSFHVTSSAPDILQILHNSAPSLIIIDLNIQQGWVKVIERIRKESGTGEIPLLAFARHTETEAMRKARDMGCMEVLPRPEFLRKLPQIVKSFTGKQVNP
jgi:two-component system response regulator